jgi:hypothetical protein
MSTPDARDRPPAALFIDADNISDAAAIDTVIRLLHEQGWRLTVRRAYGGHEKLAGLKDCFLRHGIRALVNQGKGTTDALLVVDVMDMLHAGSLPAMAAIASSDGDFAPLATRLREEGLWVICLAQRGKSAGAELAKAYDDLQFIDERSIDEPEPPRRPARKTAARKAAAPPPPPADPLRRLLSEVPGFDEGKAVELNDIVQRLRAEKLLGRSASGPRYLAKNAPYVQLTPPSQPNKVRLKEGLR